MFKSACLFINGHGDEIVIFEADIGVSVRSIGGGSVHRRPFSCYLNNRMIERKFE